MKESVTVLLSEAEIERRITELAEEIKKDFGGNTVTLVCVLKGGVMFMVELAKRLSLDVEFDFMETSSYGDATETSGIIKFVKDLSNPITGKHVLLVEDIIDTGKTLSHLVRHLKSQQPASLKICALLDKPARRLVADCEPDYTGFVIPDAFVVGFGLDYAQRYRNLNYVGVLHFTE